MEKTAQREASRCVLLTKYYQGYQIDEDKMAGARGKYVEEKCIQDFGDET